MKGKKGELYLQGASYPRPRSGAPGGAAFGRRQKLCSQEEAGVRAYLQRLKF